MKTLLLLLVSLLPAQALGIEKTFHLSNSSCLNRPVAAGFTCTFSAAAPTSYTQLPQYYTAQLGLLYTDTVAGGCTGYRALIQICTHVNDACPVAGDWETIASPTIVAGVADLNPLYLQRTIDTTDYLSYTVGMQATAIRVVVTARVACATAETLSIYLTLGAP